MACLVWGTQEPSTHRRFWKKHLLQEVFLVPSSFQALRSSLMQQQQTEQPCCSSPAAPSYWNSLLLPEGRSKCSEWLFVSKDRLAHWSSTRGSESAPTPIKGWAPDWHSITVFGMDEWRTEVNFKFQVGQCELAESHWA